MTMHTKVSGTWRNIAELHCKVSSTWRNVTEVWEKDGSTWKKVWNALRSAGSLFSSSTIMTNFWLTPKGYSGAYDSNRLHNSTAYSGYGNIQFFAGTTNSGNSEGTMTATAYITWTDTDTGAKGQLNLGVITGNGSHGWIQGGKGYLIPTGTKDEWYAVFVIAGGNRSDGMMCVSTYRVRLQTTAVKLSNGLSNYIVSTTSNNLYYVGDIFLQQTAASVVNIMTHLSADDADRATKILKCSVNLGSSTGYNAANYSLPSTLNPTRMCNFGGKYFCIARDDAGIGYGNLRWVISDTPTFSAYNTLTGFPTSYIPVCINNLVRSGLSVEYLLMANHSTPLDIRVKSNAIGDTSHQTISNADLVAAAGRDIWSIQGADIIENVLYILVRTDDGKGAMLAADVSDGSGGTLSISNWRKFETYAGSSTPSDVFTMIVSDQFHRIIGATVCEGSTSTGQNLQYIRN